MFAQLRGRIFGENQKHQKFLGTTKQQALEKPLCALWRTKAHGFWGFPVPRTQYFFPGKNRLVLFSTLLCRGMLQKWTIPIWYIWFHLHFRTRRKFFLGTSQKSTISTTGTWELVVVLHPRVPRMFHWVLWHAHMYTGRKSHPHSAFVCPIKLMCREHLQDHLFHLFLVKIVPFVHLLRISPGRIHSECPLWSVFYHLSCYTGRCHRTKSWYFLSGKTPCEEVFLVFSLFILYFCCQMRKCYIFDSTFLFVLHIRSQTFPEAMSILWTRKSRAHNYRIQVMNNINIFSISFQNTKFRATSVNFLLSQPCLSKTGCNQSENLGIILNNNCL